MALQLCSSLRLTLDLGQPPASPAARAAGGPPAAPRATGRPRTAPGAAARAGPPRPRRQGWAPARRCWRATAPKGAAPAAPPGRAARRASPPAGPARPAAAQAHAPTGTCGRAGAACMWRPCGAMHLYALPQQTSRSLMRFARGGGSCAVWCGTLSGSKSMRFEAALQPARSLMTRSVHLRRDSPARSTHVADTLCSTCSASLCGTTSSLLFLPGMRATGALDGPRQRAHRRMVSPHSAAPKSASARFARSSSSGGTAMSPAAVRSAHASAAKGVSGRCDPRRPHTSACTVLLQRGPCPARRQRRARRC